MSHKVAGVPKWTLAVNAIRKMTADFDGKIRFGLTMFPDHITFACGQGAIPIPVAPDNEAKIQSLLQASLSSSNTNYPSGPCSTNIDAAMDQASSEPAFLDTSRPGYALLITDGIQSSDCAAKGGDAGTKQIITDMRQNQKVGTFVLGFGADVDPAQLNAFADAGGMPSGDPATRYYRVSDAASLEAAFAKIATQTLGCSLTLGSAPPNPAQMFVYASGSADPISRDSTHATGWDYDAASNQITFYGATCDAFKAGTVKDVHVVFGCNGPS
ncbi:MAG: VWA domain-containing protein [Minicystis sp.]